MKAIIKTTGVAVVLWLMACCSTALADISADIRAFIGGHTRLVWKQYQGDPNDGNWHLGGNTKFLLMGLDTDDGQDQRSILLEQANYNKPILSHDGSRIVYTDRGYSSSGDKIYIVNFSGGTPKFLKNGYACDVALDPAIQQEWLYYGPNGGEWGDNGPVRRCLIDNTSVDEAVWDRNDTRYCDFSVSPDLEKAAGGFGGTCAIVTLPNGSRRSVGDGCWTQISPDTRYIRWHMNQAPKVHRYFYMFDASGSRLGEINVYEEVPGNMGWEVFHPRWSNHIEFFVLAGPFTGGSTQPCANHDCGDHIGDGNPHVEIHIGRFGSTYNGKITQWLQVTNNNKPDFYPDIWIDPTVAAQLGPSLGRSSMPRSVLSVRPNPADTWVQIRLWNGSPHGIDSPVSLLLYDTGGRMVGQWRGFNPQVLQTQGVRCDVSRLAAGDYVLRFKAANKTHTKTILKK